MKKLYLFLLSVAIVGLSLETNAQNYRLEAGLRLGGANYLGEMGGKYLPRRDGPADMKIQTTGLSAGAYLRYAITPRLSTNTHFQWGRISGADSLSTNPGRVNRNLSFRNDILEVGTQLEFDFYEQYNVGGNRLYRVDFAAYGFVGVGFYFHNPMTYYGGGTLDWYDEDIFDDGDDSYSYEISEGYKPLQPLKTEGVNYSLNGIALITGLGFKFNIKRNYLIGVRLGVRTTTTDYLDDVSTNYIGTREFEKDNENVLTENGALALELAYRSDEIDSHLPKSYDYNVDEKKGKERGNPNEDDSYIFAAFEFAYVFKGKNQPYKKQFHNGYVRRKGKRVGVSRFFDF